MHWDFPGGPVAPKSLVDGDNSQEIKRHLLLGRKAMTNLDSVFKRTDITANKV